MTVASAEPSRVGGRSHLPRPHGSSFCATDAAARSLLQEANVSREKIRHATWAGSRARARQTGLGDFQNGSGRTASGPPSPAGCGDPA